MKSKAFMATGLSIAALAAGCGGNDCPTPNPGNPGEAVSQKDKAPKVSEAQSKIDRIAQKAAAHFVNQAAPKVRSFESYDDDSVGFSTDGSRKPNYDGKRYTRLRMSRSLGEFGVDSSIYHNDIDAQYADGHPGTVRSLSLGDSTSAYKTKPDYETLIKDKNGDPIPDGTFSSSTQYDFNLVNGHWQVTAYDGIDATKEVARTPGQAQAMVDEAADSLDQLLN